MCELEYERETPYGQVYEAWLIKRPLTHFPDLQLEECGSIVYMRLNTPSQSDREAVLRAFLEALESELLERAITNAPEPLRAA